MSILSLKLAIDSVTALGNVFDELFTSDEERLDKQVLLARIAQQSTMVQSEINKVEAAHRSVFVAGWRPFIGWVCGVALLYNFILYELINGVLEIAGSDTELPALSSSGDLMTILLALLGLGGFRTFEKIQGRAK